MLRSQNSAITRNQEKSVNFFLFYINKILYLQQNVIRIYSFFCDLRLELFRVIFCPSTAVGLQIFERVGRTLTISVSVHNLFLIKFIKCIKSEHQEALRNSLEADNETLLNFILAEIIYSTLSKVALLPNNENINIELTILLSLRPLLSPPILTSQEHGSI